MVSSKKTAECQYRRNDHYWSSLEHRRLRFSFQINNVKDRDRVSPALLFSAGSRRRRLSSGRPLSCQPILSDFFARARNFRI